MSAWRQGEAFRIDASDFASGVLADRVGVLHLLGGASPPDAGARVAEAARAAGYQLITLGSPAPVALDGFLSLGTLEEFTGSSHEMRARLGAGSHFEIVPLTSDRWPGVEALLDFASPTRFSRDPHLTPDVVRRHKLKLLRTYHAQHPHYSLLAVSATHGPLGFQASYVRDDSFVLYELMTKSGLVAAELLARNLKPLNDREPAVRFVRTWIYSDNQASKSFMMRSGLRPSGSRVHHYHLWL